MHLSAVFSPKDKKLREKKAQIRKLNFFLFPILKHLSYPEPVSPPG